MVWLRILLCIFAVILFGNVNTINDSWGSCYVDPGSGITIDVNPIVNLGEGKFVVGGIVPVSMCEIGIDMNIMDRHDTVYFNDKRTTDDNGRFSFEYQLENMSNRVCDSHKVVLDYAGLRTTSKIVMSNPSLVPSWVKISAGEWSDGDTSNAEFFDAMKFLINKGVMEVSTTEHDLKSDYKIPEWIKINSGWWADCYIDDDEFIHGVEFLIKKGIIIIR